MRAKYIHVSRFTRIHGIQIVNVYDFVTNGVVLTTLSYENVF